MEAHLQTPLVLAAREKAIGQRKLCKVIHHSDQAQYTAPAFSNAMCESFFATLECELSARERFASRAEARMAAFSYMKFGTILRVTISASATSHPSLTTQT